MKIVFVIFMALCLLSGCAAQEPASTNPSQETVADIFTQPTGTTQSAVQTTTEAVTESKPATPELPERDLPIRQGVNFVNQEVTYTGGEMHVEINIFTQGYSNIGLGIRLFVDGQPQPYKTAQDSTVSYLHTFYQADFVEQTYELIFTPVTGKSGETVELYAMSISDPTFFIGDGMNGFRHTHGSLNSCSLLTFEQTPPEQEQLAVEEILMNWSCTGRDATAAEIGDWSAEQM